MSLAFSRGFFILGADVKRLAAILVALMIAAMAHAGTAVAGTAAGIACFHASTRIRRAGDPRSCAPAVSAGTGSARGPSLASQRSAAETSAARTVIDGVGRRVVIPARVNRIVTLAPNLTETVYALGLGGKLVGDTNQCDRPAAAKRKRHVGDPVNPSIEAIVALQPDVVLASTSINREETVDDLARLGIPVYTSNAQTVLGMLRSVRGLADAIGAGERGEALTARLRQKLNAIRARLADKPVAHVLFVIWNDPLITIGQDTFVAKALRWAGAESVVRSRQNWPQISMEEVVRLQPDYIVFAASREGSRQELKNLRTQPVWRDLDAVKKGRVVSVSEEALRPSPGLVNAIAVLARELHPNAFEN